MSWIRVQKMREDASPDPRLMKLLAEELHRILVLNELNLPIIYCPGKSLQPLHLVEALAMELEHQGMSVVMKAPLRRKWHPFQKSQKMKSAAERRANSNSQKSDFRAEPIAPGEYILLDDLCTTGSTLLKLRDLIEQQPGVKIKTAAVLALVKKQH